MPFPADAIASPNVFKMLLQKTPTKQRDEKNPKDDKEKAK